jgi:hypothetical protein
MARVERRELALLPTCGLVLEQVQDIMELCSDTDFQRDGLMKLHDPGIHPFL